MDVDSYVVREHQHVRTSLDRKLQTSVPVERLGRCWCVEIQYSLVVDDSKRVVVHDARWLRHSLHAQDGPEFHLTCRISSIRHIPAEYQEVVAEDANERTGCHLRREALDLYRARVPIRVQHLEGCDRLPHDTRQSQFTVHYQSPVRLYQRTRELAAASDPRLPFD